MSGEKVAFESKAEKEAKEGRDRSTIGFPYLDLEDAEEVARAIQTNAGTMCSIENLAGYLNQSARGGGFRLRVLSAKTFGLIDNPRGQVILTDLGLRAVDPDQEAAARVQSFMNVPLHRAVYQKFKGTTLPPKAGLTREIQGMGVAASQADRARQVLERSAEHAGFFAHGRDRLVEPVVRGAQKVEAAPQEEQKRGDGGSTGGGGHYHPFIEGLLQKLPAPDTKWEYDARVKWLQTAGNIFDLLYTSESSGGISIELKQ